MAALRVAGIDRPFPIQSATLPDSLAGRDVLGRGRTGSGKTLAFVIPIVARLVASGAKRTPRRPRALVLAPTRELASQIHATLKPLADAMGLRTATVFGGVGAQPQIAALRSGLDVLVACPGRLEEHLRDGHARLDAVEITVLDEADHMCDLGFLPSVRRLLDATPMGTQRLLFSATLDNGVDSLVKRYLQSPVTHSVDPGTATVTEMDHHVFHLTALERLPVLVELATRSPRTMMFTRTKHRAKQLAKQLNAAGVTAVELHGNLAQNARVRNLAAFADGSASTMVATDIAARGIHVDEISLVVHADPPEEHKAYLHRSGRTARAGASGTVITLMTDEQISDVRALTKRAGISPTVTKVERSHPLLHELAGPPPEPGSRLAARVAAAKAAPPVVIEADRPERPRRNDGARGPRGTTTARRNGAAPGRGASASRSGSAPARNGAGSARSGAAPAADRRDAPAARTAPSSGRSDTPAAGRSSGAAPESRRSAPARNGSAPARNGSAPARNGSAPARNGSAPARNGSAPARNGAPAGDRPAAAPTDGKLARQRRRVRGGAPGTPSRSR